MKQVSYFKTSAGREPCREWLQTLDAKTRSRVYAFIDRVALGAAKKNTRALGDGVFEIKIDHGPGYRVYFGEFKSMTVLLLAGGDKNTQFRDVQQAKKYWSEYVSK